MNKHEKINYIELPAKDIDLAKSFFIEVFDWSFTDFGSEYSSFAGAGIDGGFYKAGLTVSASNGSALIVFYSKDLNATLKKIQNAGGKISQPIFFFPGGHRFHFTDLNRNEYAVWSDCYENLKPEMNK